jgi:hypothetical protein
VRHPGGNLSDRGGGAQSREPAAATCDDASMSDLQRRGRSGMSRSAREQRAYRMVVATGIFSVIAVVGVVLAVVGVVGGIVPFMAAIFAVLSWLMFRRALSGR